MVKIQEIEEDDVAHARNLTILQSRLEKFKGSMVQVSKLITRTFKYRRNRILSDMHRVCEICDKYPFVKKTKFMTLCEYTCNSQVTMYYFQVAEEFKLVTQTEEMCFDAFCDSWKIYSIAMHRLAIPEPKSYSKLFSQLNRMIAWNVKVIPFSCIFFTYLFWPPLILLVLLL